MTRITDLTEATTLAQTDAVAVMARLVLASSE